jgi:dienelactone hydrolase
MDQREIEVEIGGVRLAGTFSIPADARGSVLFAHGSGSSRWSPRNRSVADRLHYVGLATLLMDLLTPDEERVDQRTAHLRFDIPLLAERCVAAVDWLGTNPDTKALPIGIFGASTGAAAALIAAARRPDDVRAVVSRGGRPDLAGEALEALRAPTLLIVGGRDMEVIRLNREAMARLHTETRLEVIPGATHLFEEPGALEEVARLAADWFLRFLV